MEGTTTTSGGWCSAGANSFLPAPPATLTHAHAMVLLDHHTATTRTGRGQAQTWSTRYANPHSALSHTQAVLLLDLRIKRSPR